MEKELILLQLVSNVCKDIIGLSLITSIEVPVLTKMRKTDYDKLLELRYKKISKNIEDKLNINISNEKLAPLVEKLEERTSKENLTNVYHNIKNLELNKTALLYLIGWNGAYNAKNNEIKYSANKSLPHEFLHMASAFYDSNADVIYDGFLVSNKKQGKVGVGLNEGYTELLASRIYRNGKVKSYKKEVKIASIIEQFFYNTKDMEDYYFNHDLPGFIFYMSQFAKKEELKKLIEDIDLVTNTNQLLSQSPNYYYLKVLSRLNNMSDSDNLEPTRKQVVKQMINKNLLMKCISEGKDLEYNKKLVRK